MSYTENHTMTTKTRLSKAARKAVKSIRKASHTLDPSLSRLIRSESRRVREFNNVKNGVAYIGNDSA